MRSHECPDYLAMAKEALRDYQAKQTGKPATAYPLVPREGCPACGGGRFRLEGGLFACERCAPEGTPLIRDTDVLWLQRSAAVGLLNQNAVRLMEEGPAGFVVGVWREADSGELREALRVLGLDRYPLRYLDDPDIPARYRAIRPQPKERTLFS